MRVPVEFSAGFTVMNKQIRSKTCKKTIKQKYGKAVWGNIKLNKK
jgi:hypothetical protein